MEAILKTELMERVTAPVKWDCPLSDYTSFRIGGPARALVVCHDSVELHKLLQFLEEKRVQYRIIGNGTNLLVRDEGFDGVIIHLGGEFKEYCFKREKGEVILRSGGGVGLTRLSKVCTEKGLSGLEFASGIPGTVGGGVMMNAGAWGSRMSEILMSIEVVTPQGRFIFQKDEMSFGYRKMYLPLEGQAIITQAEMVMEERDKVGIRELCSDYKEQRKAKQPQGVGNAGSIFKNPDGDSAGRLIEASGLKGVSVGGAEVSEKHANFIVNRNNATATEVLKLIELIREKVHKDSGILLEPEVHVL